MKNYKNCHILQARQWAKCVSLMSVFDSKDYITNGFQKNMLALLVIEPVMFGMHGKSSTNWALFSLSMAVVIYKIKLMCDNSIFSIVGPLHLPL